MYETCGCRFLFQVQTDFEIIKQIFVIKIHNCFIIKFNIILIQVYTFLILVNIMKKLLGIYVIT